MAFDGITCKAVSLELKNNIINGKINKIFEPSKNEIIFSIYCNGNNYALNINIASNCYRVNLTTTAKPNPLSAPNFCMLLRKYLIGSRIKDIITFDLERIIEFKLEGYNELNDLISRSLIVELMGKHSNIILVNENGKIIDSLRHLDTLSNSYRDILPAREYVFPKEDKISFLDSNFNDFFNLISSSENTLDASISNAYTGISKIFIQNILEILNISNKSNKKEDLEQIYNYIKSICSSLGTSKIFCKNYLNDYVIDLNSNTNLDNLNINWFLNDFYSSKEQNENFVNYRNTMLKLILGQLKKINKKLANIDSKLKECNTMDSYRLYGELLTSNLYKIPKENISSIELENYYDENKVITIPLDKTISPSYNAKKYFKKYNKLKSTLEIVSIQKLETSKEIDYLESIIYELESATNIKEIDEIYEEISDNVIFKETFKKENSKIKKNKINKKKVHEEYEPLIYTIDGFKVYVGKNNKQNDYLTTKLGKPTDIWFHTKDIRGSHVLLKTENNQVSQKTLEACCRLAAYYSKAKLSSNVPVDYCFIKDVKKPSGSKPRYGNI